MITTVRMRPVRPEDYEEAGAVTALAYREFMPPDADWGGYEKRLADVAGRATRALVLVADLDGTIAGTATLELDHRINPDSEQPPLEADEAHLRMLGVHLATPVLLTLFVLMCSSIDHALPGMT
jgi:hypothetical protein